MSRRARVAVVGAGWWASTVHLPSLAGNERAELVAVCDPDPARATHAAERFGAARACTDLADLLARPDELDGVVVATPHSTHHPIASQVLRAGLPVLVEKPLATTAADAWDLVALARQRDLVLAVGLTYQYAATAPRVRQALAEDVGELISVNAEFSSRTLGLFATTDPAQAHLDDPSAPHGTTYSDPATGGGQGHTQLTHILTGLLWASNEQAVEVSAFMDQRGLRVDVVDALAFRLAGGALAVTSSTGTTPAGAPVRHRIRFHGDRGVVEWDLLAARAVVHRGDGTSVTLEPPSNVAPYASARVSAAFVDSLLDGTPTPAPGEPAAAGVALVEAAYAAARERTVVGVAGPPSGIM